MTTGIDVEATRKLCDATTPGPWATVQLLGRHNLIQHGGGFLAEFGGWDSQLPNEANALFTAHARTALPEAVDEIVRLRAENESLRHKELEV